MDASRSPDIPAVRSAARLPSSSRRYVSLVIVHTEGVPEQGRIQCLLIICSALNPNYFDAERALVLSEAVKLLEDERRRFSDRLFMNNVQTGSLPTLRPIWNATTATTTATIT